MQKLIAAVLADPFNIEKINALYDYALVNYREAAALSAKIKGELSRHGIRL